LPDILPQERLKEVDLPVPVFDHIHVAAAVSALAAEEAALPPEVV
jgi:hypothetical protein